MAKTFMLVAAAVLLAGCGARALGDPYVAATPQTRGAQVTVTAADAGKPINLRTGDALLLRLTETAPVPGSSLRYSVDADPAVLQVTGDFRYPNQATAKTSVHSFRFTAARSGTTFVVATGHQACEAMDPRYCRQPAPLSFPVTVRS